MRIVLVVHKFFPRFKAGTEVLTLGMAKYLLTSGHEVAVVTGERTENYTVPEVALDHYEGIPVYRIIYSTKSYKDRIKTHFDNPVIESLLFSTVSALNPQIIHCNHILGLSFGSLNKLKSLGVPVIFSPTDFWAVCPAICLYRFWDQTVCNGPDVCPVACFRCLLPLPSVIEKYVPDLLIRMLFRFIAVFPNINSSHIQTISSLVHRKEKVLQSLDSANLLIMATSFMKDVFIRNGFNSDKIRLVPFGIDINVTLAPDRNLSSLQKRMRPLVIGYIGSIERQKGLHVLIKAYQSLGATPEQAVLKIYGDINVKNGYTSYVLDIAEKQQSGISFEGVFPNAEIGNVLNSIDIMVIPSIRYENTPLVLLSAIAAKVPVIVSDLGGMTEVVRDGINGFSFTSNNSDALANILMQFINTPELVGMTLCQKVPTVKNISQYVAELETIYLELLEAKS